MRISAAPTKSEESLSSPGRQETLLSVSSAARLLGVSASSLRAWAAGGKVPHRRTAGGHRRFLKSDLEQWLAERGAELPQPPARPPELVASRTLPLEEVAERIRQTVPELLDAADSSDAPGAGSSRRRRARRRRGRLETQVEGLAIGIAAGDLGRYLREAEWNGFRHGASGSPGEGPIGDALCLRWAVDRVVAPELAGRPTAELRSLQRTMDRLVVRVASGMAEGLQARRRAADG